LEGITTNAPLILQCRDSNPVPFGEKYR